MTKQVQLRRGSTVEHEVFAGAAGEVTVDTDRDTVVVHDGTAVGGFPLQREDLYVGGYKNKLINGDFGLWQRGTSFPHAGTTNLYTADRWRTEGNTFSGTVSRQAFSAGQTDVPGEPIYFLRWDVTTNPALSIELSQRIEDVRTLAGQTATVSLYAKAGATIAASTLNLRVHQAPDGTGGGTITTPLGQITTAWRKITVTVNVPTLSGATIGAASYLTVSIESPAGHAAAFTLDIARVQFERGASATAFEDRHEAQELALSQRYFVELMSGDTPFENVATVGHIGPTTAVGTLRFPVPMRAGPTMGQSGSWAFVGGGGGVSSLGFDQITRHSVQVTPAITGGTDGNVSTLRANNVTTNSLTADAEL